MTNARAVDEFDAALELRFRDVAEPTRSVAVHREILVEEQDLPEHDDRFRCAGVHPAGLGERLAFERIDPGFDLRDLGLQRRRGAILRPGVASEKRRLPEDSKHDNDHNELSVLANSFHFRTREMAKTYRRREFIGDSYDARPKLWIARSDVAADLCVHRQCELKPRL